MKKMYDQVRVTSCQGPTVMLLSAWITEREAARICLKVAEGTAYEYWLPLRNTSAGTRTVLTRPSTVSTCVANPPTWCSPAQDNTNLTDSHLATVVFTKICFLPCTAIQRIFFFFQTCSYLCVILKRTE